MISIKLILILIAIIGFIGIFVATVLWICLSKNDQYDDQNYAQYDNQNYAPIHLMDLSKMEGITFYAQLVRMMEDS